MGILTVLLSAFVLSFHNVTVRVLFSEHLVLGLFLLGGYVKPDLQNSLLLMFMRMLLVVPLMASLAFKLYPSAGKELRDLFRRERTDVLLQALCCGVLMFVYIALLYIALGLIPTGIAMTLFFTYPVFTTLLAWKFFGERPTLFRWLVMAIILGGGVLTIPQSSAAYSSDTITNGIFASVGSGVVYAFYKVMAQKCLEKFHPVPFTWISFTCTLVFSGICLLFWPPSSTQLDWTPLWIGSIFSGLVSFIGHAFNNVGIRMIGATKASIVGASSPALTVLVAWVTISETLNLIQCLGIGIVTLGIAMLSGEGFVRRRSHS
ncbi:MAG: DMT family transporter [Aulosira sp. ZfuVER01]|nr:DMT family transporter [Aulosira sp. ZfuCHP01]